MPLHMLIADDSATNRMLFATTVTRMGHQADVVATGREAVAFFNKNSYDLVFLDINMPGMDGIATAMEIQPLNKRHTPVYAITGWIDKKLEDKLAAAGVRDCLVKPLDREKISHAIGACHLENHAPAVPLAAPEDVPQRLLGVYADELRARAQACERYLATLNVSGLLREAHTLRALADMLKTPAVEKSAAQLEKTCLAQLQKVQNGKPAEPPPPQTVEELARACHMAARAIERLI